MEEFTLEEDGTIRDPKAVLAALDRAKKEAQKFRQERDAALSEKESLATRVTELEGDEGVARWKNKALTTEVKSALKAKGLKNVDRALKVLDLKDLDFNEDGAVAGLEERLTAAEKEWPEIFDVKRQVGGAADIFSSNPTKEARSGSEAQADLILGNR